MKNIILLGNSLGFISFIEKFRLVDKKSAITLLSTDGQLPYSRFRLAGVLSKEIKEAQVFEQPESFFKTHNVNVVTDQEFKSISFKRRYVTTMTKVQFDYDVLVLADTPQVKLPAIKGHQKRGVFNCVRLSQAKEIIKHMPFVETMIVTVETVLGLKTAAALTRYKKEVKLIVSGKNILSHILDEESSAMLRQLLEQKGVQILAKHSIAEILGDQDVKAVRLNTGKVLSGELVVLDESKVDGKFFPEELYKDSYEIDQECFFKTEWPEVYSLDAVWDNFFINSVNDYAQHESILREQGKALAAYVLGEVYQIPKLVPSFEFAMEGLNGFWMGKTQLEQGAREFLSFDAQKNIYKKVFAQDDSLIGGTFFNTPAAVKEKIQQCIETRLNIQGVEDYVLEENFGINQLIKLQQEKSSA